jgi:hypothetical protein
MWQGSSTNVGMDSSELWEKSIKQEELDKASVLQKELQACSLRIRELKKQKGADNKILVGFLIFS